MSVKVLDAGGKLMLTSELRTEVEVGLADYIARGAKIISAVHKLGSFWVAACTLPTGTPVESTSLHLSSAKATNRTHTYTEPEVDDGCTVEELGFKHMITGPSREAVESRIDHLKQFGAELVSDIEQYGDSWTAVVDTGGADKSYRW